MRTPESGPGTESVLAHGRDWFGQRRPHFIRQVVEDFFLFVLSFQELYQVYLGCRDPRGHGCADLLSPVTEKARATLWNQLTRMIGSENDKGRLWQLKDLCHLVWPEQENGYDVHGSLLDWLVGSVFHEAMKLKENIYLLNTYGPAAVRIRELAPEPSRMLLRPRGVYPRLSSMVDVESLVRRIASDVISQMEQMGFLLGQANFMLRMMMPELAGNPLVIRLLVEKSELVDRVWGESVEEVLADMFAGSPVQGFCAAGRSYLLAQWYDDALAMYQRALAIDPGCDEARARVIHLQALVRNSRSEPAGEPVGSV